ncbi:MAG: ATP-binding protein [Nitrospirae bacterium]|nr:ATP-binding protein [Nitrospirota bacterium]
MIERLLLGPVGRVVGDYAKMAFVSGPRQVGKTTLAKRFLERFGQGVYVNWDVLTDQKRIVRDPYFFEKENRNPRKPFLVVLDEIHKYARWKSYLKGAFDGYSKEFRFLVTGSGRLDLFKRGGDSLLGRYMGLPLFPLSVGELSGRAATWKDFKASLSDPRGHDAASREAYEHLTRFSGFPEPFTRAEESFYNIWLQERRTLLIREDIRSATGIRDISLVEALAALIPDRIGSPLSMNALREDLGVAFESVRDWIETLSRFFYLFRLPPFTARLTRSIKKETKAYLYDWGEVETEPVRFENVVALHLYKAVQTWRAVGEGDVALHFLRDRDGREVDFVVVRKGAPVCLIEVKQAERDFAPSLVHFQRRMKVPTAVQVVHGPGVCRKVSESGLDRWILSADRFLGSLP